MWHLQHAPPNSIIRVVISEHEIAFSDSCLNAALVISRVARDGTVSILATLCGTLLSTNGSRFFTSKAGEGLRIEYRARWPLPFAFNASYDVLGKCRGHRPLAMRIHLTLHYMYFIWTRKSSTKKFSVFKFLYF